MKLNRLLQLPLQLLLQLLCLSALISLSAQSFSNNKSANEEVEMGSVQTEDIDITQATAKAQKTLDQFITIANQPTLGIQPKTIGIKVLITESNLIEHLWLTDIKYADNQFTGVVGNPPRTVRRLKHGKMLMIPREEVLDWAYIQNGVMQGNYTLRALLPHMNPKEAKHVKKQLGWD